MVRKRGDVIAQPHYSHARAVLSDPLTGLGSILMDGLPTMLVRVYTIFLAKPTHYIRKGAAYKEHTKRSI